MERGLEKDRGTLGDLRDVINSSRVGLGVGSGGAMMGMDVDVMAKGEGEQLCRTEIYRTIKTKYTNLQIQRQVN